MTGDVEVKRSVKLDVRVDLSLVDTTITVFSVYSNELPQEFMEDFKLSVLELVNKHRIKLLDC